MRTACARAAVARRLPASPSCSLRRRGPSSLPTARTLRTGRLATMATAGNGQRSNDDKLSRLLEGNRKWSEQMHKDQPDFFDSLKSQQNPEYLWIGCSDSRVPANQILGLMPGDVFVHRNVGNLALHNDLNFMSCLEFAVKELKVKTIILCGHYGCGAVKCALSLPQKTEALVNCWISDIRQCRNEHASGLSKLEFTEQHARLCELNAIRQVFSICTSPVVQSAWANGQDLSVYGVVYALHDGLLKPLVGPLTADQGLSELQERDFIERVRSMTGGSSSAKLPVVPANKDAEPEQVMEQNSAYVQKELSRHLRWSDNDA